LGANLVKKITSSELVRRPSDLVPLLRFFPQYLKFHCHSE
jgi:hypothetical protein